MYEAEIAGAAKKRGFGFKKCFLARRTKISAFNFFNVKARSNLNRMDRIFRIIGFIL